MVYYKEINKPGIANEVVTPFWNLTKWDTDGIYLVENGTVQCDAEGQPYMAFRAGSLVGDKQYLALKRHEFAITEEEAILRFKELKTAKLQTLFNEVHRLWKLDFPGGQS